MCSEYNGWVNYETWNMALWIGEVDGLSDAIDEQAQTEVADALDEDNNEFDERSATYSLSKYLEELCHETFNVSCVACGSVNEFIEGPMGDAIGSYYGMVNWYDIAKHYIADAYRAKMEEK